MTTLLTATLAFGAIACGGAELDVESAEQAATSKTRSSRNTIADPPADDGSADYLTCWCNTEQGSGDGSGCYFTVSGSSCSGECECSAICGELED